MLPDFLKLHYAEELSRDVEAVTHIPIINQWMVVKKSPISRFLVRFYKFRLWLKMREFEAQDFLYRMRKRHG